ncbi:MAG: hypothetical protein R2861_12990 [Desulfobacterales bacterium]
MKEWNWFQAGIGLAASFLLAVILVQPIGCPPCRHFTRHYRQNHPSEWVQADGSQIRI